MEFVKIIFLITLFSYSLWANEIKVFPAEYPLPEASVIKPGSKDLASGASSDSHKVWYYNGIGGHWLAVGNPNILNRRDKVTVRFDLSGLIFQARVKKAWLHFLQKPFGYRDEEIIIEHFTVERWVLSGPDLISTQTELLGSYVVKQNSTQSSIIIDVTEAINRDLSLGYGWATFRVASRTAELLANPENKATGITMINNSIQLLYQNP